MEIRSSIHPPELPGTLQPKIAPTLVEDTLVLPTPAGSPPPAAPSAASAPTQPTQPTQPSTASTTVAAAVAPASSEPPTRPLAPGEALPRFFGLLLELRAEVQNLQESMARLRSGAALVDADARAAELAAALAEGESIDRRNRSRIGGLLARLRGIMEGEPRLHQWCADQVIHVENCWERAEYHLDRLRELVGQGKASDAAVLAGAIEVAARLQKITFMAAYLTVPQRVNDHLGQLRIGQALDFHRDFGDELPDAADRHKLLVTMRSHPNEIHGVIDVERGLIYKTASQRRRQVLSLVMQAILFLFGFGIFAVLPEVGAWKELSDRALLLERYLFVAIGAVLHLSMSTLKQRRKGGEDDLMALDDFLLWIHVREVAIAWTVFSVWIGAIGLSFVSPQATPEAALIVGYSLDSFIDVFLLRFEAKAGSVAKSLAPRG